MAFPRPSGLVCPASRHVLLVDDDMVLMRALRLLLERQGHTVRHSACPAALVERVAADAIDLVVLDPSLLPFPEVLALCSALYVAGGAMLLLVSRRPSLQAEIQALEAGADGYLVKPVSPARLLAHALALLRRGPHPARREPRPATAEWALDEDGGYLMGVGANAGRHRHLSQLELRLLCTLLDHPGEVVGRFKLLPAVFGPGYEAADEEMEQYVHRLRKKLEPAPDHPRYLLTVRGVGYRFCDPEHPAN